MSQSTLVLLLPDDPLTGLLTLSSLQSYGYDVLLATTTPEAEGLLEANRRIGALVVTADLPEGRSLALAKASRAKHPKLAVIYTSRMPHRIADKDKVANAPCLRVPYHPHQLVGVLGQLTGRVASEDSSRVA
ncbi:MAG TPA: response regulator [Microvirga sp.]|jgi:DNA-binding response OmpR family regulator|nr:response regulator [Microvirga sp.]